MDLLEQEQFSGTGSRIRVGNEGEKSPRYFITM